MDTPMPARVGDEPPRESNAGADAMAERRRQAAETFADLGHLVAQSPNPRAVAARVAESARALLGAAVCTVFRKHAVTGDLHAIAFSAVPDHTFDPNLVIPAGHGVVGLAVAQRAWIATPDALQDDRLRLMPDLRSRLERGPYRALLAIPLFTRGDVVGAIVLVDRPGRVLDAEETRLVGALGDFAAIALENSRLYEEADQRRRAAETVAELSRAITGSLQPAEVAKRVVDGIRALLGAQYAGVYTIGAADELRLLAHAGASEPIFPERAVLPAGIGVVGAAVRARTSVISDDMLADPRITVTLEMRKRLAGMRARAVLAVPLFAHETVVGALGVRDVIGRVFTEEDVRLVRIFADHAAIALENARLFADEQAARTAAERSEQRVRDLVRDLDAIVWEADAATGAFSFVSDRAETLLRYPVAHWRAEPDFWIERVHPDDRERMAARRHDAVASASSYSDLYRMIAADGAVIWVRDRVQVLAGAGGGAGHLRGVMVDVTSAMSARAALEAQTRQQAAVAELGQRALAGAQLDTLMDEASGLVARALSLDHVAIMELAPDARALLLRAGTGWGDAVPGTAIEPVDEHSQAAYTALTGMAMVVDDVSVDPRLRPGPRGHDRGPVSGISVAIDGEHRTFGVLTASATLRRRFTDDDMNFMKAVANVLALAIERKKIENTLEQRTERLRILREIDQGIALAKSPAAIAHVALTHVRRLIPCRIATVSLFHSDSGEAIPLAIDADPECQSDDTVSRSLAEQGILESLRAGHIHVAHGTEIGEALDTEGIRSLVDVPLIAQEVLIGVLTLASDRQGAFLPAFLEIAREVSRPLAVAIEQARLNERVWIGRERLRLLSRRLVEVQEQERRHLSRELHDEVGQVLTGLKFTLEAARSCSDPVVANDLDRARTLLADLMQRVRNLSLDLRPAMLDDLGLLPTLLWHFDRYRTEAKIDVDFKQRGIDDRRFGQEIETAVYRIVQEALTNVARHAATDSVVVLAWADATTVGVKIEDHGVGFDQRSAVGVSRGGLTSMRERSMLLGGRFEIESAPGEGVRVIAELPLASYLDRRAVPR